jgi:polar amino acid transport system substrate-binding protein
MVSGKIDVKPLITHRFPFNNAQAAYQLLEGKKPEFYVGIILDYDQNKEQLKGCRIRSLTMQTGKKISDVNLGVIGAGNFARTMLLPHLKDSNVNLSAIATATGISCKDTARKFGFELCTTDYSSLLSIDKINTILIATRHNMHGKLVLDALTAGKHVYTEKPLCLDENELNKIATLYYEKAKESPLLIMVGFNRRYAPLLIKMKEFFKSCKEPMIMHYRVNAGFKDKKDWYQDKAIGGGRIIGEVCHFIDTLQYITGALPVSVFAQTIQTENQMITPEDNVIITIEFSDGSIGSITYLANGDPYFPKEYIEAFCENQVAVLDNFAVLTTMAKGKKKTQKGVIQDKGHRDEMKVFVDSVKKQTMPIPFESLYATTLATFKIHESIGQKLPINITQPAMCFNIKTII